MTSVPPRPSAAPSRVGPSEFDILKQNHRFLREDEQEESQSEQKDQAAWNKALARKFYNNLWKEYALCDLKHYKSGSFGLRWRTEEEVVAGTGESSCGNTRCKRHEPPAGQSKLKLSSPDQRKKDGKKHSKYALHTLELPFGYVEDGQVKSALVKVVLCDKCVKKIMWKREQEKTAAAAAAATATSVDGAEDAISDSDSEDAAEVRREQDHLSIKEDHDSTVDSQKILERSGQRDEDKGREGDRDRNLELQSQELRRRRRNYPEGFKRREKAGDRRRRHSRSRSPNRHNRDQERERDR